VGSISRAARPDHRLVRTPERIEPIPVIGLRTLCAQSFSKALALPTSRGRFVSGGEYVGAAREVILAQARSHPETDDHQARRMISAGV
jgi:hypothetical protein